MKMKITVAELLMVSAGAIHAATFEFQNKSKISHYWDDPADWQIASPVQKGVVPTAGNTVQVDGFDADSTLYLTNDISTAFYQLILKGGVRNTAAETATGSMRFLGTGVSFVLPESQTAYHSKVARFQSFMRGAACDLAILQNETSQKSAQLSMADFDLLSGIRPDGSSYFRFVRGLFDFYDPANKGTGNGAKLYVGFGGSNPSGVADVSFAPGTNLRVGDLILDSPDENEVALSFDGAQVGVTNSLAIAGGCLSVSGGRLSAGQLDQSGGVSSISSSKVSFGGVAISAGRCCISNQADVAIGATGNIFVDGVDNPRLEFAGGKLTTDRYLKIGKQYSGVVSVSGGVFNLINGDGIIVGESGGTGTFEMSGGTATVTRVRLARGSGNGDTTLRQSGGLLHLGYGSAGGVLFLQSCTSRDGVHKVELNGGILETRFIKSEEDLSVGTRSFCANGGTLRPVVDMTSGFIAKLTEATVGEKGLVLDTQTYNVGIEQDFTNKTGTRGRLRKLGSGTVTYAGQYDVAETSIEEGTLQVKGGSSTFLTSLSVSNGAKFSLAGDSQGVTLEALAVTNAVLFLDPGDVISVKGPVSCKRLQLQWTTVPEVACDFLVVDGALKEETRLAIANAMFANALPDGKHATYEFSYDATAGKTTVKAKMSADVPLSSTREWTGTGDWDDPANWTPSDSVPQLTDICEFTSAEAGKTVTLGSKAVAGALSFGNDGYLLGGAGLLELSGEQGAARIDVAVGSHVINVPVGLSTVVPIQVEAGASLEMAGPISRGGIEKGGTGRLTLSATATFEKNVISADGILGVRNSEALGVAADDLVTLQGGTIEFNAANGESMHVAPAFVTATPDAQGISVFKADTDVVLDSLNVNSGAFAKRGTGTLTLNVPADQDPMVLAANGGNATSLQTLFTEPGLVFPDDGTAPLPSGSKYPSFAIAEGEMVLKGAGAGARARISGMAIVGSYSHVCEKQPMLTVNGVELDCTDGGNGFYVGCNMGNPGVAVSNATLQILNGAKVIIAKTEIGRASGYNGMKSIIVATNGSFQINGVGSHITRMNGANTAHALYRFKDSSLLVNGSYQVGGGIDLEFDHSVFSGLDGETVAAIAEEARPRGVMYFRNGSVFASTALAEDSEHPLSRDIVFAFDDSEWACASTGGNYDVPASLSGKVRYEMRGKGVALAPDKGCTYTIKAPFEGDGGFINRGEGVVKFASGTYAFTGVCNVESGTVDLSDAGLLTAPRFTGSGVLSGASANNANFVIGLSDDWQLVSGGVPTIDGCALAGRVKVDAGRSAENPLKLPSKPLPLAIGRISGGKMADVSGWKLINTGDRHVCGEFSIIDGTIYLTPCPPKGLVLVVR